MPTWNENLATGIAGVDEQHREIFRRTDRLLAACREGRGREHVGEMIEFLSDYVIKHFDAEERLQEASGYPGYRAHKELHDRFLEDFAALRAAFREKGASLTTVINTNRTVVDWLVNHISVEDKAVAEHIRNSVN